jgi:hypothetical protein
MGKDLWPVEIVQGGLLASGRASGGTATSLIDTKKNYAANALRGKYIKIIIDDVEYVREIISNTADTITFADLVAKVPVEKTKYYIVPGGEKFTTAVPGVADVTDRADRELGKVDIASSELPTGAATEAKQDDIIAKDFATETTLNTVAGYVDEIETLLTAIKDTAGIKKITDALPAGENRLGKMGIQVAGADVAAGNPVPTSLVGSLANQFEQLTIDATVGGIALTSATYGLDTKAYITIEVAPIRFRIDGISPTATVGHLLNIGDYVELDTAGDVAHFRAIRTTGVSAVINCTYSA